MNKKNKKLLIILIVAVIIAASGGAALYFYLVPQKVTMYVFKDNYKAGEVLSEEMLTPIQADSKIVVAGNTADTSSRFVTGDDITAVLQTGDSLRMDVSAGMPLTIALLSVNGGSSVEMNMDPSKVAVSIPISSTTGVTKDLKEGSRVNIYATGMENGGTVLLFQNMRVLSVAKDSNGELSSTTIEVDINQSLKLIYAANNTSLYLGLVDSAGYEFVDGEPSYTPGS